MTRETEREIRKLFDSDHASAHFGMDASVGSQARIVLNDLNSRFASMFGSIAKEEAARVVGQVNSHAAASVAESLKQLSGGATISVKAVSPTMKSIMKAAIAENVDLIKSLPAQYMRQVGQKVMHSIVTGQGLADLIPDIQKRGKVSEGRAKLIATDQTKKVYTALSNERVKRAGVKKFEWLHSGGGQHPRDLHVDYDGEIFDYENPPIIDKNTGERGLPGQLINCKCKARPILDFGNNQ